MSKKDGARVQKRGRATAAAHPDGGEGAVGMNGAGSPWSVDAGVPVGRYMKSDVAYLRENMWVDAAVAFLETRGLADAPVLDQEGRPVGVLYVDDVESEAAFIEAASDDEGEGDDRFTNLLMRRHGLGNGFHLDGGPRLRVRDVMVPYVPEVAADASIAAAALVMRDNQLGHVMVVGDDGRAVGVFAREDLVRWLVEETHRRPEHVADNERRLGDVMRPVITIRRRATLTTARDLMTTHDLSELPVVEGGRVMGVITEMEIIGMLNAHRDDDGWMQELLVEDVMSAPALVGAPGDLVANLHLDEAHGRCVMVAEHGRIIGIVTERDLDGGNGAARPGHPAQLSY